MVSFDLRLHCIVFTFYDVSVYSTILCCMSWEHHILVVNFISGSLKAPLIAPLYSLIPFSFLDSC